MRRPARYSKDQPRQRDLWVQPAATGATSGTPLRNHSNNLRTEPTRSTFRLSSPTRGGSAPSEFGYRGQRYEDRGEGVRALGVQQCRRCFLVTSGDRALGAWTSQGSAAGCQPVWLSRPDSARALTGPACRFGHLEGEPGGQGDALILVPL